MMSNELQPTPRNELAGEQAIHMEPQHAFELARKFDHEDGEFAEFFSKRLGSNWRDYITSDITSARLLDICVKQKWMQIAASEIGSVAGEGVCATIHKNRKLRGDQVEFSDEEKRMFKHALEAIAEFKHEYGQNPDATIGQSYGPNHVSIGMKTPILDTSYKVIAIEGQGKLLDAPQRGITGS